MPKQFLEKGQFVTLYLLGITFSAIKLADNWCKHYSQDQFNTVSSPWIVVSTMFCIFLILYSAIVLFVQKNYSRSYALYQGKYATVKAWLTILVFFGMIIEDGLHLMRNWCY